jgi:hypothetical protein
LLSTGAGRCDPPVVAGAVADPSGAGVPEVVTGPVVAADVDLPGAADVLLPLHPATATAASAASARAAAGPARRQLAVLNAQWAG